MFCVSYIIFLFNLRYEKQCLICHLYGKIIPAKTIRYTRGMYGKPFIVYEFYLNGELKKSRCLASTTMIKNFKKGREVNILRIDQGSISWILEKQHVPLLTLSKTRRDYLLETLSKMRNADSV